MTTRGACAGQEDTVGKRQRIFGGTHRQNVVGSIEHFANKFCLRPSSCGGRDADFVEVVCLLYIPTETGKASTSNYSPSTSPNRGFEGIDDTLIARRTIWILLPMGASDIGSLSEVERRAASARRERHTARGIVISLQLGRGARPNRWRRRDRNRGIRSRSGRLRGAIEVDNLLSQRLLAACSTCRPPIKGVGKGKSSGVGWFQDTY